MAGFAEKLKVRSQKLGSYPKRRWSARVVMKYTLLQLPGTALLVLILFLIRDPLDIQLGLLWSIVAFWVAKDVILFPLVWRSYDPEFPAEAHSLVDAIGVTVDRLAPSGHVRVRGELWRAEATTDAPIRKGSRVHVREMRGLTLLVEPESLRIDEL